MESTDSFVSINELAKRMDIPAHTLRYWEKQFPTAIKPVLGAGGRRYYRAEVVAKFQKIKSLLYDRGMTIAGVKKMLHNGDFTKEQKQEILTLKPQQIVSQQNINRDEILHAIDLLEQAKNILK